MTEPQFKILLFSEDEDHIAIFKKLAEKQVPRFKLDVKPFDCAAEELISNHQAHLIVIDFSSAAKESAESIMSKFEPFADEVPLIGVFSFLEMQEILVYIKRGIRDFLNIPLEEEELLKIFTRFQKLMPASLFPAPGKIYTFFSFKGGAGNTFVTSNTAAAYYRLTHKRTLLWDMALLNDDVPFFLNCRPKQTLSHLLGNLDQMDEAYLKGSLPPHASGFSILAAPQSFEETERVTFEAMEKLTPWVRQCFDSVFVDAGCRFSDILIPLTDASSFIFVTTTLELISLKRAARCLEILHKLHYAPGKIKIIVNRYHAKHEAVSIHEAKDILKYDFVQFISNDYETASKCLNLGRTVGEAAPHSRINLEFKSLAEKIEAGFNAPEKKNAAVKPFFKFLKENAHVAR